MHRRAFLKLAASTAIALAAGMEILAPRKLDFAYKGYSFDRDPFPIRFDINKFLIKESSRISKHIWFERDRSAWLALATPK
jgi:hypothetical protein